MPNQQRTYQVGNQQLSQIGNNNNSIEQNSKHIKCMSQGQFNAFGSHGELNSFNGIKWIYVLGFGCGASILLLRRDHICGRDQRWNRKIKSSQVKITELS